MIVLLFLEVTVVPEYTDIVDTQVHCDSYTWIDGVTYTVSNNTASYTYHKQVLDVIVQFI